MRSQSIAWPGQRCARVSELAVAAVIAIFLPGASDVACAETPTLGQLSATRQRPLFAPTRRAPPDDATRAVAKAQQPPPDLSLNAIIHGPGLQMALLKRSTSPKPVIVKPGMDIDGWSVSTIAPRHVILTLDGRSLTLAFPRRLDPPIPVGPTRRAELTH